MLRIVLALTLLTALPLAAQEDTSRRTPWTLQFEVRGEFARALGDLQDLVGSEPGFGLGVAGRLWLSDAAAVYAGWDWYRFANVVDSTRAEFTDPGFRAGAQYQARLGSSSVQPFVYAGAFNSRPKLELRRGDEREAIRFDRSWGGEVGGGVVVPLTSHISLVPEARYRLHDVETSSSDASVRELDVRYLGLNIGILYAP
jgi:hypothetical protein